MSEEAKKEEGMEYISGKGRESPRERWREIPGRQLHIKRKGQAVRLE